MAKRGLGKGLGALFGEEVTLEENTAVKKYRKNLQQTGKKQKRSLLKRS